MITSLATKRIRRYHSGKHFSEFYTQDGGESQLASKLRSLSPYVYMGPVGEGVCGQTSIMYEEAPAALSGSTVEPQPDHVTA